MQTPPRRLYRSRKERMIAGICGGLAQFLGMDASLIRLAVVLITFFWPAMLLVYPGLLLIIPEEPLVAPQPAELNEEI